MNSKTQRIAGIVALLLVFCTSQIYVSAGFAAPDPAPVLAETSLTQEQDSPGILTTVGNKPINVNGAASITGATVLSGASIETPEGVSATVSLGKLGSVEIEQNAKLTLNFQLNSIKVILLQGCVTLRANKGITGEIETSKDAISRTDPKTDGVLRVCHPDSVKLAAATAAAGGLGKLAMLAIIGGPAAAIIPVITPGNNPSNSNPT
ncbi:MAG: hypothetical protein H7Z16_10400 [Pyrinomonadaceae bacterium]|nr:hypothetical protein [Pyrinomonadaceae bacterium]